MTTEPDVSVPPSRRVFLVGATGTIGRATVDALVARGYQVVCFLRPPPPGTPASRSTGWPAGVVLRTGDVTDPVSLRDHGFRGEPFDAVISCMASRTGAPDDAWAIDHRAHLTLLEAAKEAGVPHFVLLSAICVQKPRLQFQHAKLAFEEALMASGLTWSIVRPTAFFKSISGQVARVMRGRPFLLVGDGTLTACKPISDRDMGEYLAGCLADPARQGRVLPIGGPGEAITPRQQGEHLFALLGQTPRFRQVPVGVLNGVAALLGGLARVFPRLEAKAEFARIGRYYATESMLVWDAEAGRYDADATPSFGEETLFGHYARLVRGETAEERGDHSVF
jgi:divinyl chlorophyllide a 8-vinyl-reductase